MKLQKCHEIVGRLSGVKNENGKLNLTFAIETEVEIVSPGLKRGEDTTI